MTYTCSHNSSRKARNKEEEQCDMLQPSKKSDRMNDWHGLRSLVAARVTHSNKGALSVSSQVFLVSRVCRETLKTIPHTIYSVPTICLYLLTPSPMHGQQQQQQ